jgi:beta-mannosidase
MRATMPGSVHFQLHNLKKIPDVHRDRNELAVQWVDRQTWELRRIFQASAADCRRNRQELIFDSVDTVATVWLNGKRVGASANMFRQLVCDVRGVLKPGRNELCILIKSPTDYAQAQAKRHQRRVSTAETFKWQTGEAREVYRPWIRKVQCHFGWDWGLCLPTQGLAGGARLECSDAPRLASLVTAQIHRGPAGAPRRVMLRCVARLEATASDTGVLVLQAGDKSTTVKAKLRPGENRIRAQLTIENPSLWWPNGHGSQSLYPLEAQWVSDGGEKSEPLRRRIGLRTLELVTKDERARGGARAQSFGFRVNGRMIYAKGANWIPVDQFTERCTPNIYRHLLKSAASANMNMIRVWGGGWYESDVFYDLCDELGLLVWQDFMMACALYPDTPDFVGELESEARYQVRRLADHPCIALWCGDNENQEGVAHWWSSAPNKQAIYRKLMLALKRTVEAEDPTRRFWLSSPSNNRIDDSTPGDPNRGDVHFWAVWHGGQPFAHYLDVKPRFASEFGFQSFPEPRSIAEVVSPGERNPSSWVMEHHQRSGSGNVLIATALARELPIPKDFSSHCWLSQINQAMAMRTAVEHWRRLKPWCMGTIFWQLNDIWPVASWSSVDHRGRWKVLQHFAERFYAQLLPSFLLANDGLELWVTSDVSRSLSVRGALVTYTWSGRRLSSVPVTSRLEPDQSRKIKTLPVAKLVGQHHPRDVCCFVELTAQAGVFTNFTPLVPFKWAAIVQPHIRKQLRVDARGTLALDVRSQAVAPFFHAELEGLEGHFQGDWQVLKPKKKYTLRWVPHGDHGGQAPSLGEARRRLRVLSLFDMVAG